MNTCEECSRDWQDRYNREVRQFNRQITIATTVTLIALCISLICVIITAVCVAKTIEFIGGFEYVEETLISQDGEGQNIAVIDNSTTIKGG